MSESRARTKSADVDAELNEIADELYAQRPEGFAAARDEQVRKARAEGKQPLARELAQLRRPTQSAWLINLLWRDQREVMEQLFELAQGMSRAQAEASGPELHRLMAQRRELEAALIRRAKELGEKAGVSVSASMEREAQETLAAALANPEVAVEVRTGRLLKAASYAGFGVLPSATPPAPGSAEEKRAAAAPPREPAVLADRAAQRARERRAEAERRVEEARAAEEVMAAALAEQNRAANTAELRHRDLRHQLEELQTRLRALEDEVQAAEHSAVTAARRRDQAQKAHDAATQELVRAEQELNDLPAPTD